MKHSCNEIVYIPFLYLCICCVFQYILKMEGGEYKARTDSQADHSETHDTDYEKLLSDAVKLVKHESSDSQHNNTAGHDLGSQTDDESENELRRDHRNMTDESAWETREEEDYAQNSRQIDQDETPVPLPPPLIQVKSLFKINTKPKKSSAKRKHNTETVDSSHKMPVKYEEERVENNTQQEPVSAMIQSVAIRIHSNVVNETNTNQNSMELSEERPHACDICGKAFKFRSKLSRHRKMHLGEKPEPVECKTCGKQLYDNNALGRHMMLHTGEKPFECKLCDKKFNRFDTLQKHTYTHTGEKPFICPVCNRAFSNDSNLRKHKAVHMEDKRYECSVCHKKFARNDKLKLHSIIHTGEKPHVCQVCGKAFNVQSNLKVHLRTHIKKSPPPPTQEQGVKEAAD